MKTAKPIKHLYRVNAVKHELMRQETDYLLQHGLARPSSSAWSSPCLLGEKPDGSLSLYHRLSFPLPQMEDCVDSVGNARYVTKLDLLKDLLMASAIN